MRAAASAPGMTSPEALLAALTLLADDSCVPVVVMDRELRILLFNRPAERLLGFDASEVLGRPCLTAIRCQQCMQGCPIVDEAPGQMIELHRKDGTVELVERSGGPVRDLAGDVVALVEVLRPSADAALLAARLEGFLTRDPVLSRTLSQVGLVARTDAALLVVGGVGSGRTLLAHAVHDASRRERGPKVHVHGAMPPADWATVWSRARGGTVVLDEVTQLCPSEGARLLASWPVPDDDVRIITIAEPAIDRLLAERRFDERLYYRLRGARVDVPPLAQRPGDVPFLFERFLAEETRALSRPRPRVSAEAMAALEAHDWPGNVRELRSAALAAAISAEELVQVRDLPREVTRRAPSSGAAPADEAERIRWALQQTDGRVGAAAALLGTSRATFWRWRRLHGV